MDYSDKNTKESFGENFEEGSEHVLTKNLSVKSSSTSEKASFNDRVLSTDSRSVNGKSVPSVSESICPSSLSADESGGKTGCELVNVIIDESFAQNAVPKKQKRKVCQVLEFIKYKLKVRHTMICA